ncbi:hypothetical protein CANINC_002966 [Pichia inconspicua]|uniref:EF-hand domain-containing protein n=1 Tax=Pichia inconspicua TaxID=52247 RepID=A0A4V4NFK2_9ASCO|nr:hypothetical protein CANINC_002966 [[Candida] inconspicua]
MFSRSKNRPLELKLEDSNYAPAPSPQSIKPQPAVGQKSHTQTSPHGTPNDSSKPIQKLANAYNEINRPIPSPSKGKNNTSAPTVINNYYYVQPPISPRIASAPVSMYSMPLASDSPKNSPRNKSSMSMTNYNQRPEPRPSSHSHHDVREPRESRDFRDRTHRERSENDIRTDSRSSSALQRKSPSKYPRLPNFADSSSQMSQYDYANQRSMRNSSKDFHHDKEHNYTHETDFDNDYARGYDSYAESKRNNFKTSRGHPSNQSRSSSYSEHNSDYDIFVKSSASSNQKKSPTRGEKTRNGGESGNIYTSKSLDSRSRFIKSTETNNGFEGQAIIPKISVDPDFDVLDKFSDLEISKGFNLLNLLSQIDDADISVHDDSFFKIFKQISDGNDFITIEQLGVVLFDPYKKRGRFSYRSLALIMGTFVQNSLNNGEMDFRCFVKMCKFIKGCFSSFNYHDKIHKDHVLDFNEFHNALKSNNIICPDELLAKIFASDESIDIEHYIAAIIMIRKAEKQK